MGEIINTNTAIETQPGGDTGALLDITQSILADARTALNRSGVEDILVSRTSQLNLIICEQQAEACCSPLFMGEPLRLSRIRQRAKIA